ncbi:hypothetical protein Goshw_027309 [Gossypium schwendimanii]|uniref:Uncharacterized protein n=1 Tax=Gossypium schwendimanii TaxID=34291 RepID=A0A7J9MYK4_GOSSC|nr:hypothetical protein [Gossypium schwendimanii]
MLMVETVEWCLRQKAPAWCASRHLPRKELTWKKLSNA